MEQEIELIVAGHGVLTRVVGLFIALETLVQMGLAFGVVEGGRGLGLCGNGGIGSGLQLLASVKEVLKLMEPITHPSCVLARRLIAGNEANAPIRGHADAVEAVLPEVFKMGFPGLGRAIRGQLDFEDGRTLRLNRDQDRLMAGKNLIAEIKHHFGLCHREG